MSPCGEPGDGYMRPPFCVVFLQFLVKSIVISKLKVKKKKTTEASSAWIFLGLWSLWLGLPGAWRVRPSMGRMVARPHGANIWNKTTPTGKVKSEGDVDLRESGNPWSATRKKTLSPLIDPFSQGQLLQRYPFVSRNPLPSALQHFLTRPAATSNSFQSACKKRSEPGYWRGETAHGFKWAWQEERAWEWPLGNRKERARPADPASFLQAAGVPVLSHWCRINKSWWNYFAFYQHTFWLENFFLP